MNRMVAVLAFTLALLTSPIPGRAADEPSMWVYCLSMHGDAVYFSGIFSVSMHTYGVGIENSFNSYVAARHDPGASSGALCMTGFDSYQEAADDMNDDIAVRRRSGKQVVVTRWSYRGD